MPLKIKSKKNRIGKKVIITESDIKNISNPLPRRPVSTEETQIIRKFHQIQKGYTKLMVDVVKELELVKKWIGYQAVSKQEILKNKFASKVRRHL